MFVSSTEHHAAFRGMGTASTLPERYGADFLWPISVPEESRSGWVGVQRKDTSDLLASTLDGRLGKELSQLRQCEIALLLVEGRVNFTNAGEMVGQGGTGGFGQAWTQAQWRGVQWSIRNAGVWVDYTVDPSDTADTIRLFERWTLKPDHTSLIRREKVEGLWGKPGSEDYARHLLMGLPGVGVELATRIVKRFGGVPWQWTVGEQELQEVEGIGPRKVKAMMEALTHTTTREME